MFKDHFTLAFVWIMYCFIHSLLANDLIKIRIESFLKVNSNKYRLIYNIIAFLNLVIVLLYHFSLQSFILFNIPVINIVFAMIFIAGGMIIMSICILKYFSQLSGLAGRQKIEKPVLETTGIHSYVRHPLYLGTFIFLVGLFLKDPLISNLIAMVIIITYTIIGIRFEERKLLKEFGDQYMLYKKNVPMLIPFLK